MVHEVPVTTSFGTGRQRTLGALLRRLRKQSGLSGQALANRLGVSQSHLSRIELGGAAATRELVAGWLDETGAGTADRATATDLATTVAAEFGNWREALAGGLVKAQREIAAAEAASATRCTYLPLLVPGLLQTPEYAHSLVATKYADRVDLVDAVAARMQRQVVLYDRAKSLRWVIGEPGLRWQMAPRAVMVAQLDRLAALAEDPNLDLRVLPLDRTAPVWHSHGFTMYCDRADGEPDLVNVELLTGPLNIRDPDQVREYRAAYERLASLSVGGPEAVRVILAIRDEVYPYD
jgi:transcriptional regulator with XRE-family HTH domain